MYVSCVLPNSVCLSIHPSISLICLLVSQSASSIHLYICQSLSQLACLSGCLPLSIYLSVYLSIYLSVYLSNVYISIFIEAVSFCLSIYWYISIHPFFHLSKLYYSNVIY